MNRLIEGISSRYPLENGWSSVQVFSEVVRIGEVDIHSVGLIASHAHHGDVTASAAQLGFLPLERAYFELLERTSTISAANGASVFNGRYIGQHEDWRAVPSIPMHRDEVFPRSPNERVTRFSISNGVAAHTKYDEAVRSAVREAVERDSILRSWFGETRPLPRPVAPLLLPRSWSRIFRFESYLLEVNPSALYGNYTAVAVGYPIVHENPLVYGFAAREHEDDACFGAALECIQRLAFLWGESQPANEPLFSPTPDYHQEVFLMPRGTDKIRSWMAGQHYSHENRVLPHTLDEWRIADLTPEHLKGRLHIVRALSNSCHPLWFGRPPFVERDGVRSAHEIHPIA